MNIRISESEVSFIQSASLGSTRTFTQHTVSRSEIIFRAEIRNNTYSYLLTLLNITWETDMKFKTSTSISIRHSIVLIFSSKAREIWNRKPVTFLAVPLCHRMVTTGQDSWLHIKVIYNVHRLSVGKRLLLPTLVPRVDCCEFSRYRSRLDHLLVSGE